MVANSVLSAIDRRYLIVANLEGSGRLEVARGEAASYAREEGVGMSFGHLRSKSRFGKRKAGFPLRADQALIHSLNLTQETEHTVEWDGRRCEFLSNGSPFFHQPENAAEKRFRQREPGICS
jgi:hypothetical protein